jgi:hypothetical protein
MFLHAETTAQSRLATYSEKGSAEHLFALIDLCELIERHKKFILACANPADAQRIEGSAMEHRGADREFGRRLSLQDVIGRKRPVSAIKGIDRQCVGHLAEGMLGFEA